MFLTWKNTFAIIMKAFKLKTGDFVTHLDIHKATISRHINGTSQKFTYPIEDFYKKLLDPTTLGNPVNKYHLIEKELLLILQTTIEAEGFRSVMNDLWEENFDDYKKGHYEKFVMAMLRRTKPNPPTSPQNSKKTEKLLHPAPILMLSNALPPRPVLFGRKANMEDITNIFANSNYAVLTGVGGIGKSYIALAYAHELARNENITVQHVYCENTDSLRDAIMQLRFDDLVDNDMHSKLESNLNALRACRQSALIILDNLEQSFSQVDEEVFRDLEECRHIKLLITSRQPLVRNKLNVVHIKPLDDADLLSLYLYHRFSDPDNHKDYITKHRNILKKIFIKVDMNTLMIELLGRLAITNSMNEKDIYKYLDNDIEIPSVNLGIEKDGKNINDSIKNILKKVFSISMLDATEKSILSHMALVPLIGIKLHIFEKLTGFTSEQIRKLKRANWIIVDEESYLMRLHPMIHDVVCDMDETRPTKETCNDFLTNLESKLEALDSSNDLYHYYNRIRANAYRVIYWYPIKSYNAFPYLKDKYQAPILALNKLINDYINES